MQPSASNETLIVEDESGQVLAVRAESLFLLNLLLLPGIAFIVLSVLYYLNRNNESSLARCHLRESFWFSIYAGMMIIFVNILILLFGGYGSSTTWVIAILYFISIHTTFIFFGVFALSKAINKKHYHYPFTGSTCLE